MNRCDNGDERALDFITCTQCYSSPFGISNQCCSSRPSAVLCMQCPFSNINTVFISIYGILKPPSCTIVYGYYVIIWYTYVTQALSDICIHECIHTQYVIVHVIINNNSMVMVLVKNCTIGQWLSRTSHACDVCSWVHYTGVCACTFTYMFSVAFHACWDSIPVKYVHQKHNVIIIIII